jgi:hypothetical protein
MAEEFQDAFDLGDADGSIATVDADGVALAAIRGAAERIDDTDDRIAELEAENEALRERLDLLEERLAARDTDDTDSNTHTTDDTDQHSQSTDTERTTDTDHTERT